ncbi:hypothetical protein KP509_19G062900 [Ceratopteris richardii]|uniref:BZIP domain-containing protein n=1 Tax=Ceratopteris richardii TaxID=49495 RepID=A0A8T2SLQ3_CERRI|nr:hypothetical protein KP509_19G062900 [Ceratopteris richardii]
MRRTLESHFFHNLVGHGEDSNLDDKSVPDMAWKFPTTLIASSASNHASRKKRNPVDKQQNCMKRFLRNRFCTQQARGRKKGYLSDMEARIKEIEQKNAKLKEKVSSLKQENIRRSMSIRNDDALGAS